MPETTPFLRQWKDDAEALRKRFGGDNAKPRQFDLAQGAEQWRLLHEVLGYLKTCSHQHHGTDFDGRKFAIDALNEILSGGYDISIHPSV